MTTRRELDRQQSDVNGAKASGDDIAIDGRSRVRRPEPAGPDRAGGDSLLPISASALDLTSDRPADRDTDRASAAAATNGRRRASRRDQPGAEPDEASYETPDPQRSKRPDAEPANSTTDSEQSATEGRAGVDARRRGWFWHWNNVVTQYAPLIGLKGVGLLNSYTVWTDRRDESPHRGYAFPSQQSEAAFYGEERAELITINKILVALDLIEIRKEMLTRVDDRGRRWRVPHNLYRVKDRPDGVDLRADDVLRVALLAKRDDAVFRYVRRVFSDRFKPIDGDNVWQSILTELRNDPTWRELQERTRAIEERASARTRAGHQNRASAGGAKPREAPPTPQADPESGSNRTGTAALSDMQQTVDTATPRATSVDGSNTGLQVDEGTDVDRSITGLAIDVAGTNGGFSSSEPTSVAAISNGRPAVVGPGNTTYDQSKLTTTTTTTSLLDDAPIDDGAERSLSDSDWQRSVAGNDGPRASEPQGGIDERVESDRGRRVASDELAVGQPVDERIEREPDERQSASARTGSIAGERRLADPSAGGPLVDPGRLVISTFEDANDRRATPLERNLLAELERDADLPARASGSTGAEWLVAAMREAVSSGSAFVAPKRIREIITRWSANPRNAPSAPAAVTQAIDDTSSARPSSTGTAADIRLPGGASGDAVWTATLADLARILDRDAYDRLLAGSRITRYWRGAVEVEVASNAAADKLSGEYRGLVERHLNSRLRRPAHVRFDARPAAQPAGTPASEPDAPVVRETPQQLVIAANEVEIGRQVWQSLLGDLARVVAPADLDRLAGIIVLGQDATGAILLGTPSPLARRLIDTRYRADIESSLAALLGQSAPIRTLDAADWCPAASD
jgi:hypothetical protein